MFIKNLLQCEWRGHLIRENFAGRMGKQLVDTSGEVCVHIYGFCLWQIIWPWRFESHQIEKTKTATHSIKESKYD